MLNALFLRLHIKRETRGLTVTEYLAEFNSTHAKKGTTVFTWREKKPEFDEVAWCPQLTEMSDALDWAFTKLQEDPHVTRVVVQCGTAAMELNRNSKAA